MVERVEEPPLPTVSSVTTMTYRNISRYTYSRSSFQGWRLGICRRSNQFVCYFSDRRYGSEEAALQAAQETRERLLAELKLHPENPRLIFERFRAEHDGACSPRT